MAQICEVLKYEGDNSTFIRFTCRASPAQQIYAKLPAAGYERSYPPPAYLLDSKCVLLSFQFLCIIPFIE